MAMNFNDIGPCDVCYNFTLPECPVIATDVLQISGAGLANNTLYHWYVEDKHKKTHTGTSTTNGSGVLSIAFSNFDEGYFTRYSGVFILYLKISGAAADAVELTFNSQTYGCIQLSFEALDGTTSYIIQ